MNFDTESIISCRTCRAAFMRDGGRIIECRCKPPVVTYRPDHNDIVAAFPIVEPENYCLMWRSEKE